MCPRCGASVQPTWSYCRECGYAPEPVAEPDLDEPQDVIEVPPAGATAAPGFGPGPGSPRDPDAGPDSGPDSGSGWGPDSGSVADVPSAPGFGPPTAADDTFLDASDSTSVDADAWGAPRPAAFDAPTPSAFSTGATPAPLAPMGADEGDLLDGGVDGHDGDDVGSKPPAPGFASSPGPALYAPTGPVGGGFVDDAGLDERFDAGAFDPDALAGTPYEEPDPEVAEDKPSAAPAPIVFEGAPSGPGLPVGFGPEPATPRPPVAPTGGGSSSSPFSVNRVVAVVAIVLGALILVGGIVLLTGGGSKEAVSTNGTPGKSTPPPLGALAVSTTAVGDALSPATTTTTAVRDCDTVAVMRSVDGAEYTPCTAKFKINFPGRPDTHVSDADLSMGRVQLNVHSSTSPEPPVPIRYEAAWAMLPKEPTQEEALEGMGALTGKMGCSLTGPIMFQDQPAYACKGPGDGTPDPKQPTTAVGVTFVRGNIVYALVSNSYVNTQKQLDAFAATFTPV